MKTDQNPIVIKTGWYQHQFSSVQSLNHDSQHARPPCPSPTPRVHSDSCPSSQWCHPAISSSVVPFSSCPQSLPASESFPMSQLFAWGGQSTGVSASASFQHRDRQMDQWNRTQNLETAWMLALLDTKRQGWTPCLMTIFPSQSLFLDTALNSFSVFHSTNTPFLDYHSFN